MTGDRSPEQCAFCGADAWTMQASFDAPPVGETDFGLAGYRRSLWQCGRCGHVVNHHRMNLDDLYTSAYWDKTYGGDRMAATYDRIMALPEDRSDNRARVKRISVYCDETGRPQQRSVLDVGSGLAVFPAVMRMAGWQATALDPDARGAAHAEAKAGVDAIAGDFMTVQLDRTYGLVSFNKVLEHVRDPVGLLARAKAALDTDGLVYVELPDGEAALKDSAEREEFFVEHYDAYSMASIVMLAKKAGFRCDLAERVREPSGKYTLRAFLTVD
jgi:SAM-dependent methyltransferase